MNTVMNCRVPYMAGVFHQSTSISSSNGRNLHNVVGTWLEMASTADKTHAQGRRHR